MEDCRQRKRTDTYSGSVMTEIRDLRGSVLDGRYLIINQLGAGSFGTVYEIDQLVLDIRVRRLAIKVINLQTNSKKELANAFSEALMVMRLFETSAADPRLQHIIRVHEIGMTDETNSRPYIVMPLLSSDLSSVIVSGGMPAGEVFRIFRGICSAVSLLHDQNTPIVHRDIKPGNVLLDKGLKPVLSDYGLATAVGKIVSIVRAAGDLSCQAPECFIDETMTPASDVYSLGLVLLEMLTGEHPFRPNIEKNRSWHIDQRKKLDLERIAAAGRKNTAPLLFEVLRRCLKLDPNARFSSAVELLEFLDEMKDRNAKLPSITNDIPAVDANRLLNEAKVAELDGELERLAKILILIPRADPSIDAECLLLEGKSLKISSPLKATELFRKAMTIGTESTRNKAVLMLKDLAARRT